MDQSDWIEQHNEISKTINRTILTIIGFIFFCLLTIGQPDSLFLQKSATVKVPFANVNVSLFGFYLIGPLILLALYIYLHIYIKYLLKLNSAYSGNGTPSPYLFNINTLGSIFITDFFAYWSIPLTVIFFSWKAMAFDVFGIQLFIFGSIFLIYSVYKKCMSYHYYKSIPAKAYNFHLTVLCLCVISFITLIFSGMPLRRSLNLTGADLSGKEIIGYDLEKADLFYANLKNAILTDVNFRKANLSYANFEGAVITNSNLIESELNKTKFNKANINKTLFMNTWIRNCEFISTILDESSFDDSKVLETDFENASLFNTSFKNTKLKFTNFIKTNMNSVIFSGAIIESCDFSHSNTMKTNFSGTALIKDNFNYTILDNAIIDMIRIEETNFNEISLKNSTLCINTDLLELGISTENLCEIKKTCSLGYTEIEAIKKKCPIQLKKLGLQGN